MTQTEIEITSQKTTKQYVIYALRINNRKHELYFTHHAIERIAMWKLTISEIINALLQAEEVVTGHRNRLIAHQLKGDHVIRIVYEYRNEFPVIITVYVPRKERYYQGGGVYVDKIFF